MSLISTYGIYVSVRNYAAVRGDFNFSADDIAYTAVVEGAEDEILHLIESRLKKLGLNNSKQVKFAKGQGHPSTWVEQEGTAAYAQAAYHAQARPSEIEGARLTLVEQDKDSADWE